MYAGRYLWWNMMALGLFVFFSIFFFYLSWLGIRLSGCAAVVGNCGKLEGTLNGVVRPMGLLFAGILVLTSTVLRIHYLKLSLLWGLALFVWFGASSDFFFMFGNLWMANIGAVDIGKLMPVEALFLIALCGFLAFPFELWEEKNNQGGWSVISFVTGFTASYSFCFTIAKSDMLLAWTYKISGSEMLVELVRQFQLTLRKMLGFGDGGIQQMLVAFAVFVASLIYLVIMRRRVPPPKMTPISV